MVSINFKARYIGPVSVLKKEENNYTPTTVSFVEFNPNDANDLTTLSHVSKDWGKTYATNIYKNAYDTLLSKNNDNSYYYGVVLPQDSYEKIDKKNVLGLVQYTPVEQYANVIDFLQVNPKVMYKSAFAKKVTNIVNSLKKIVMPKNSEIENSGYKGIGTGIIDVIKCMSNDDPIVLFSDKNAVEFYKKNGFFNYGDTLPTHSIVMFYNKNDLSQCDDAVENC